MQPTRWRVRPRAMPTLRIIIWRVRISGERRSCRASIVFTSPFTDTLPGGVVAAGAASTSCGGSVTSTASSVTLTGGSIPANGSCTVSLPVTAANGGAYLNSLAIGDLQTSNGSNAAPAVATLTVPQPTTAPTLGKGFNPAAINAGGNSTLTITLSNNNGSAATMTAPLTDTLPVGVTVAATPTSTCGGSVTSTTSSVTLAGGTIPANGACTIPANGACTITVPVIAAAGGSYFNTLPAGALQTSNGNNTAPASATLTVSPPASVTLNKAFSPASIKASGNSTLTITLSNTSSSVAYLTSPLTDVLPAGVVLASTPATTCRGILTGHKGDSAVTLTGGSIPAHGSCTVTVNVTAPVAGSYFDSLAAGALHTDLGNNAAPAIATLTVIPAIVPPTLQKSFSPASIGAGGCSTLTITLSNTNNTAAKLTSPLTDSLPCGLDIASTPTTTCGGTVTGCKGDSTVTLKGGSIPANGFCTVTVKVTAAKKGSYCNKLSAGALHTDKGCNAGSAQATLTVTQPVAPKVCKSFSPATIKACGSSILTITLSNSNGTASTLTAPLTDNLPGGMTITSTPTTTCGGTVTGKKGDSAVTLKGGSIPANGSCTVTAPVTINNKGSYCNKLSAGALQTDQGCNASAADATLTVNN